MINPVYLLRADDHWQRTRRLMVRCLSIWFFFAFLIHFFADALNQIIVLGFPLGWYMAAQGSLIVFVILCFWFAWAQQKIDNECEFHDHPPSA